uniref:Uncharacterized protein n=1 Tax=Rhizophora mucronata TaxID=61149 RepID=A0A2P2L5D4_RHIMU
MIGYTIKRSLRSTNLISWACKKMNEIEWFLLSLRMFKLFGSMHNGVSHLDLHY